MKEDLRPIFLFPAVLPMLGVIFLVAFVSFAFDPAFLWDEAFVQAGKLTIIAYVGAVIITAVLTWHRNRKAKKQLDNQRNY